MNTQFTQHLSPYVTVSNTNCLSPNSDDYDKKEEECKRLNDRNTQLLDSFTQLKKSSTVTQRALSTKLEETSKSEEVGVTHFDR